MKLHEFNLVMLLTAPAAEDLTLMGRWGGRPGDSSQCTCSVCVTNTGFLAGGGGRMKHTYDRKVEREN